MIIWGNASLFTPAFFASCYLLLLVQYTKLDKNSTHRDGSGWPGGNLVDMSEFSSFISCSLSRFCTAFKTASLFSWCFQSSTKNWSIGVRLYTIYNLGGKWKALNKPRIDTFVCSLLITRQHLQNLFLPFCSTRADEFESGARLTCGGQ